MSSLPDQPNTRHTQRWKSFNFLLAVKCKKLSIKRYSISDFPHADVCQKFYLYRKQTVKVVLLQLSWFVHMIGCSICYMLLAGCLGTSNIGHIRNRSSGIKHCFHVFIYICMSFSNSSNLEVHTIKSLLNKNK